MSSGSFITSSRIWQKWIEKVQINSVVEICPERQGEIWLIRRTIQKKWSGTTIEISALKDSSKTMTPAD